MTRYRITVETYGYEQFDVEAEDEDAAREKLYSNDIDGPIDWETSWAGIQSVTPAP